MVGSDIVHAFVGEEDVLSQSKQAKLLEEQIRREQRSKLCAVVGGRDFDQIATNKI